MNPDVHLIQADRLSKIWGPPLAYGVYMMGAQIAYFYKIFIIIHI